MMNKSWIVVILLMFLLNYLVNPLTCNMGYGQRGLYNNNGIAWTRSCPKAQYCFEAVTHNINAIQNLIEYPWNPYYNEFFIRACGGDYGTPLDYHPWRSLPKSARTQFGSVKLNLTFPIDPVLGYGGTGQFSLSYTCRHKDLCVKHVTSSSTRMMSSSMMMAVVVVIGLSTYWW